MKTAKDYPVTNPYNPPDHNGADRAMSIGIPIVIEKVVIGYSGNTGKSTGPHVHTQAGTDAACQNVVDPRPYEFKPGTVTAVRTTDPYVPGQKGGEWGKYVCIKTLSGKYITYAHLSQVNVKVGQVINGEEDMDCKPDAKTVTEYFVAWEQRKPTVAELADYTSKSWRYLTDNLLKDTEAEKKAVQLQFEAYKKANPPVSATVLKPGKYEVK